MMGHYIMLSTFLGMGARYALGLSSNRMTALMQRFDMELRVMHFLGRTGWRQNNTPTGGL